MNPVASILRAATRAPGEKLNVLTCSTHERTQSCMSKVNATFYMYRSKQVKDWDFRYAPLPDNHILLDPEKDEGQLPVGVDFDVVLSQNKAGQIQILSKFARALNLPLVSLEHTLPMPTWPREMLPRWKAMRGHFNVFITGYSRKMWGWGEDEAEVIHHGIDSDTFSPGVGTRRQTCLSVVNDWINRNEPCGYHYWREATSGLPTEVVGATPGLSEPAKSVDDLVSRYRSAQIFVNTSLVSPIPTALLEAMACGCCVVSTATCAIPEVIEDGVSGFLCESPEHMRAVLTGLMDRPELCKSVGENARLTVRKNFSLSAFTDNWDKLLRRAANMTYTGAP